MKFVSKILCLAGMVSAIAMSMGRANAYTLTYNGLNYGQSISISYGSTNLNCFAGQINMSFTGSAGTPTGYATTFNAYCVELENNLQSPMEVALRSTNDLTRNGNSPNSGLKAAWLYNTYGSSINSNTKGAALQIAIWEALYDSSADLAGGYFKLLTNDSGLTTQVNTYLTGLQNNYSATTATWFQAINPASSQDLLGPAGPGSGGSGAVPEPGIVSLLAGSSLSGFCLLRRKSSLKK